MAKVIARNAGIYAVGRNVSGRSNSATLSMTGEAPDGTAFGANTRERLSGGIRDFEFSTAGFFDTAASQVDELYSDILSGSAWWGFYPVGPNASQPSYDMMGVVTEYSVESPVAGATTTAVTVAGSGGILRGKVVSACTYSGAAACSHRSIDMTGATTVGVWGVFRLQTITGTNPEISACLQESTDDSSFTTLIAFTTASVANAVQAASAASAARYLRISSSLLGTSPCATFIFTAGSRMGGSS